MWITQLVAFGVLLLVHPGIVASDDGASLWAPSWLVSFPEAFHRNHTHHISNLRVASDEVMPKFEELIHARQEKLTAQDGEQVDALDHFFWGMEGGIVMELGALDGRPESSSVSYDFIDLGWKRILIEGNPSYEEALKTGATDAYAVVSAVCSSPTVVHFVPGPYTGGIVEFMTPTFIEKFHKFTIWDRTWPRGNLSSIDFHDEDSKYLGIRDVHCLPMVDILAFAHIKHVNFFVLDTEGGELQILESIDFHQVRFDVICVETEPAFRIGGVAYEEKIAKLLFKHGYHRAIKKEEGDHDIMGRNTWYIHESFTPRRNPDVPKDCYRGAFEGAQVDWRNIDQCKKSPKEESNTSRHNRLRHKH
jgi:hypothetical protein